MTKHQDDSIPFLQDIEPPRYRGRKKPKWMITYLCATCTFDSGRTELDGPWCFYCQNSEHLTEIKRVPMSPDAIAERLKISSDRMIENLLKAYNLSLKDWPDNLKEEMMLLKAMAHGKKLKDALKDMKWKRKNKKKNV